MSHTRQSQKYGQSDRDRMAESGAAMADGSYPIADADDMHKAIHAVGRGRHASHDAIRRHIIARAEALRLSSFLPADWASDGSLSDSEAPRR